MYREYGINDNGDMIRANGGDSASEEDRKKKLAAIATMLTGQATPMETGYNIIQPALNNAQNTLNTAQNAVQTFGQPTAEQQTVQQPVAQVQQPVAQQQPTVAQPAVPTQLPQPGPGVQVAGPMTQPPAAPISPDMNQSQAETNRLMQQNQSAQGVPTQGAEVSPAAMDVVHHNAFVDAVNSSDMKAKQAALGQLIGNPNVSEGLRTQATQAMVEDYQRQRAQQEAMRQLETATPNDLARYMKERDSDKGSYVKAILYGKLGLQELAQREQEKLAPQLKAASATDSTNGQRYTVYRNNNGEIVKAFDAEGKLAGQEEIARLSAATLPTQAHQLPAVHGSPVQRTVTDTQGNSRTETGLIMYDPQSQSSYVQVGNKRLPTTGWTTMSQNPTSVFEAEAARKGGGGAGQGFDVAKPGVSGAASIAQSLGIPVISGNRTTDQQAALYQQSVDAGTPGKLPNGNPVAKPGTSAHESNNAVDIDSSKLTPDQRKALAVNGFRQPLPKSDPNHWEYDASTANKKSPLFKQEIKAAAEKKEAEVVAEAKGKEGAKQVAQQAFADNGYHVLTEVEGIIKRSTGSGIGAGIDNLARVIGTSPKGAQAIAELRPLAGALTRMIPRFEGAQSDADVREYKQNAGDFANPELPVKERLAALQGMIRLMKIYDKEGNNDWSTFGGGVQEKTIDGVAYINDGKGWKKK